MKNAALLLLPLAVGCSEVSMDSATEGSATSDMTTAAPRYREIDRVFNRLGAADVSGCNATFRFVYDNWMDCSVDLDAAMFPLEQLENETLPIRTFSFPTEEPGVTLDVRVEQSTLWSPLPTMRLNIAAHYVKAGEVTIHQMPADHYTCDRLTGVVTDVFAKLSHDDSYASRMIALTGPGYEHPLATDTIVGDLFVATQTTSLDLGACQNGWVDAMSDSWPEPDHWMSYCQVSVGGNRQSLPLTSERWSTRLRTLSKADPIVVRVPAETGKTANVSISYGTGGYVADLALIDDATGQREDVSISWKRAEGWIANAFAQLPELRWSLLLKECETSALLPGEKIEGRLVLRNRTLDIE